MFYKGFLSIFLTNALNRISLFDEFEILVPK
jgi:hypothetical protein